MAIKRKRPTDSKPSAVKEFTDRVEPRKAFWSRYAKMVEEGSTIITFYGAGGVGKTALLKKIEDEIKHRDSVTNNECKYVQYDFSISTDLREILRTFKFQLSAYGCAFPLFDAGNYYFSLKTGQDITPIKAKSMMQKIPWLNEVKTKLERADALAGKVSPLLNTAKTFFAATDEVLKTFPVMKTITTCFSIVDTLLVKYMEYNEVLDDDHQEIRRQLNARLQEKNPVALHEYLPTLFAQDVADWLQATGNRLVMLLDNYESVIGATTLATEEQLKRDLWLRGDEGLIFMIPDTLWTIAGRNKLRWDGELADELDQHLIKALSPEDSDWFLQRAGIADENLRGELVKLTEGYPIFLDLCVDVYVEYKRRHDDEPLIDEFGIKRQDVVARIFRYLDADRDDAAKDMLEFLCVMNVWTDDLAVDIGGRVLKNFSRNTYKRVKEFTFIQKEHVEHEELDLTIYRFDKTIQSILVATCDAKLIGDTLRVVGGYLKEFFADGIFDTKKIFCLKLLAELIVRLTDDAENLRAQFDDALIDIFYELRGFAKFDAAEEILLLFMSKIETLAGTESIYYAAFEVQMNFLRQSQGKYAAAYEFVNSAYEKFLRALGDKHPDTLDAMHELAINLSKLGRYEEALTLNEKVLSLRKEIFGDKHPDTINAMESLAAILDDLGRFDEALTLQEKVLATRKEIFGDKHPDTINAMQNLAMTLEDLGRLDEALTLNEKVLNLYKEILGYDEHPDALAAMNNLSITLSKLGRYEEALTLDEKVLATRKEILGDEHPDTLGSIMNLAHSFNDLGRHEEALTLLEKVFAATTELLGDKHTLTINAGENLAITLENLGRYDEALALEEKVLSLRKEILGEKHPLTIYALDYVALMLSKLERHDEAAELQQTVLSLRREVLGENHPEVLFARMNLAGTLAALNRYEELLTLSEKALADAKEIFGDEHPVTVDAMSNLAYALSTLNRREEALQAVEQAIDVAKEIFDEDDPKMQNIIELREEILASQV